MEGLRCACVLASILLSVGTADHAPALVWGTHKGDPRGHPPALESVAPERFRRLVENTAGHGQKSLVIAFFEKNLSLEDFSWRDSDDKIAFPRLRTASSSAPSTSFFPSVQAPLKALRSLQEDGYDVHHVDLQTQNHDALRIPHGERSLVIVELDDAKTNEDRPDMLRRHDDIIGKMYSESVRRGSQVTAIYTGHHPSWVEAETPRQHRVRRLLAEDANNTVSGTLWRSNDSSVLFYSKSIPYVERGGIRTNLSAPLEVLSVVNDSLQTVKISFAGDISLQVEFPVSGGYWSIGPVTLVSGGNEASLKTYPAVEAPLNFSYHCSQSVVFSSAPGNASLVFDSFQVQPFLGEPSFGDTYDCVWFFTSVMWSAFFVTLLLGSILVWGLGMILNIRTMDQFDDPKGKTIQVTTSE
ncbi:V-type proton ATPase subunit S1-like [Bacillus rossius redtenbacheri]|uniref:V-type proton ATPase subunit S1-like n=1 Tax=Bacillus rossius redtenbacheri TaxID=93214 RepID=UPI002FDE642B